jgi:hypothetical protein
MPGALRMHVRSLAKSLVMRSLARRWHPRSPAGHGWWPRPETRDPWTVKDALVHIVDWKSHTARAMRGQKRPPALRGFGDIAPRRRSAVWPDASSSFAANATSAANARGIVVAKSSFHAQPPRMVGEALMQTQWRGAGWRPRPHGRVQQEARRAAAARRTLPAEAVR